ncbi:hypothetical protein [Falsiroseomonas tokyonensis]|uniref:Uncharacterized protein n=1 Tax=Falsiroseomonas tokyonensis TaxID=430521 RepID=A0ABV7C197_9PROT|nr:hypothetical protein [Falsiroseomonas tokyonensis]MBU8540240.1 hypothetical protein [Falsiroseomonas tokyonensis]
MSRADLEADARHHALLQLLDLVAPAAERAKDALTRYPPADRPYGLTMAQVMDEERERLVRLVRQAHHQMMQRKGP